MSPAFFVSDGAFRASVDVLGFHKVKVVSDRTGPVHGVGWTRVGWLMSALVFIWAWVPGVQAQQLILNPGVEMDHLDRNRVRAIFTMRLRRWDDGTPIRVFVLPDEDPLHQQFAKQVLGVFAHQLRRAWDRQVFSGTGQAPAEVKDLEEMRRKVRTTPGAIGYLPEDDADEGVRVLHVR